MRNSNPVTHLIAQHRCNNRCSSTIRRFVFEMKYDASTKYRNLVFGSVEISLKIFQYYNDVWYPITYEFIINSNSQLLSFWSVMCIPIYSIYKYRILVDTYTKIFNDFPNAHNVRMRICKEESALNLWLFNE